MTTNICSSFNWRANNSYSWWLSNYLLFYSRTLSLKTIETDDVANFRKCFIYSYSFYHYGGFGAQKKRRNLFISNDEVEVRIGFEENFFYGKLVTVNMNISCHFFTFYGKSFMHNAIFFLWKATQYTSFSICLFSKEVKQKRIFKSPIFLSNVSQNHHLKFPTKE